MWSRISTKCVVVMSFMIPDVKRWHLMVWSAFVVVVLSWKTFVFVLCSHKNSAIWICVKWRCVCVRSSVELVYYTLTHRHRRHSCVQQIILSHCVCVYAWNQSRKEKIKHFLSILRTDLSLISTSKRCWLGTIDVLGSWHRFRWAFRIPISMICHSVSDWHTW